MKPQPTTLAPTTRPTPRPAGMSDICDAYHPTGNPDGPYLRRCRRLARVRMTLSTAADCFDVKRCPACAAELRGKVKAGATFEILAEVAL